MITRPIYGLRFHHATGSDLRQLGFVMSFRSMDMGVLIFTGSAIVQSDGSSHSDEVANAMEIANIDPATGQPTSRTCEKLPTFDQYNTLVECHCQIGR
jgi:hypothetical protein